MRPNASNETTNADEPDLSLDLNSDENVNEQDRRTWIVDIKNTYFGDANLDGEFSSGDLVAVFQAGKYETRL